MVTDVETKRDSNPSSSLTTDAIPNRPFPSPVGLEQTLAWTSSTDSSTPPSGLRDPASSSSTIASARRRPDRCQQRKPAAISRIFTRHRMDNESPT